MPFTIRMGVPEMEAVWSDLSARSEQGRLDEGEKKCFLKLVKALRFLREKTAWRRTQLTT
jgi:hypothetical protein